MNRLEILADQMARGGEASRMLQAFGTLHADREKHLVDSLIAWFQSKPWDEREAIKFIAAMTENRKQFDELSYRATKGVDASEKLHATASEDAAEGE